jgi:hypothetical protein
MEDTKRARSCLAWFWMTWHIHVDVQLWSRTKLSQRNEVWGLFWPFPKHKDQLDPLLKVWGWDWLFCLFFELHSTSETLTMHAHSSLWTHVNPTLGALLRFTVWVNIISMLSEDNWKLFTPKLDQPYLSRRTHHHMFLEVYRVEGLWNTKKSQFGERFSKNVKFFSPTPNLPTCGTRRTHCRRNTSPLMTAPLRKRCPGMLPPAPGHGHDPAPTPPTTPPPSSNARIRPRQHPWCPPRSRRMRPLRRRPASNPGHRGPPQSRRMPGCAYCGGGRHPALLVGASRSSPRPPARSLCPMCLS